MPLVIVCGPPCSGKTTRARQLCDHLAARGTPVELVNEEALAIDRNECYKTTVLEKNLRGTLKAAVERCLNKETVVILDWLNYIKGYRYELYCVARALATPHCVLYCPAEQEEVTVWNANRAEGRYNDELLVDLYGRFETPIEKNRWDAPLFTVQPEEPSAPVEEIAQHLLSSVGPKPNVATNQSRIADTNFVHALDTVTQEIVAALITGQNDTLEGDPIAIAGVTRPVRLTRKATAEELRKIRRQFLKIAQMHPPQPAAVGDTFIDYILAALNQ